MSVEDHTTVDAIGIDRETGSVVLTISDHLPWDEGNEHLLALQGKINRYLAFIESGELLTSYADAAGRPVRIEVVCKYPASRDGLRFMSDARTTVRGAGASLVWRVLAA